jgi:signal transduction histidine kinase
VPTRQGLPRRLRYAFILQAVTASFAIVIGIYAAGVIVKDLLAGERMRAEAASYWDARGRIADASLPDEAHVQGTFLEAGGDPARLPVEWRALPAGIVDLPGQRSKVLVDPRPEGILYLTMSFGFVDRVILWTGVASMLIALLVLYLVTWLTYRTSKRLVTPVNWLAGEVSRWDPRDPNATAIAPENLPREAGSEVQQLGGALHDLTVRVRDFVQRERDFTRDASHELRTPLTVIRVATDLILGDPDVPVRAHRSLARIQRAGRDMEAVIDAFLILAREDGIAPQREDFDVRDVVYEEVAKVRPLLAGKPVELIVTETGAPRLHASPHVLSVMLGNLLSNACTFTEEGMVEVRIEDDRVVVRDSGIGMSVETLQKAHEPFYRANQFSPSGKGMGLSIVHRLGERFGWPVMLESTPAVGTTATIRFVAEPGAAMR